MILFVHSLEHTNLPILSSTADTLLLQTLELPNPLPDRLRKRTFVCVAHITEQQRVKCSDCIPLSTQSTEISVMRYFHNKTLMRDIFQHFETGGSQDASIHQGATRMRSLN